MSLFFERRPVDQDHLSFVTFRFIVPARNNTEEDLHHRKPSGRRTLKSYYKYLQNSPNSNRRPFTTDNDSSNSNSNSNSNNSNSNNNNSNNNNDDDESSGDAGGHYGRDRRLCGGGTGGLWSVWLRSWGRRRRRVAARRYHEQAAVSAARDRKAAVGCAVGTSVLNISIVIVSLQVSSEP
jgi:hypothetical protein